MNKFGPWSDGFRMGVGVGVLDEIKAITAPSWAWAELGKNYMSNWPPPPPTCYIFLIQGEKKLEMKKKF